MPGDHRHLLEIRRIGPPPGTAESPEFQASLNSKPGHHPQSSPVRAWAKAPEPPGDDPMPMNLGSEDGPSHFIRHGSWFVWGHQHSTLYPWQNTFNRAQPETWVAFDLLGLAFSGGISPPKSGFSTPTRP